MMEIFSEPENANNNNNNNNKEDVAASADDAVHNSTGNRERQQGVPWTEEEHKLFLRGLQKLGKGDWRGISRNFVKTRTPTQVASHAESYFNRRSDAKHRSRRSTRLDIMADISNDSRDQMEDTDTHLLPLLSKTEHIIDMDRNHVNHGTHKEDGYSQKTGHIDIDPNGVNHEIHREDDWSQKSNDSRHQMEDTDTHLNTEFSLPLLLETEYKRDVEDPNHVNHRTHREDGWSQLSNDSRHQMEDTDTQPLSLSIDNNPNGVNHEIHLLEDGWSRKVILERIFVITNFVLEILSAVFEQLSSAHKPQYALISMLISFIAMLVCIVELIYKGRKEKVAWRWTGYSIPWFYNPSTNRHFGGTFNDIIGLACAIPQFIFSAITYSFVLRNANNPIKICVWPIIFAFGLLCSKFLERPNRTLKRDS